MLRLKVHLLPFVFKYGNIDIVPAFTRQCWEKILLGERSNFSVVKRLLYDEMYLQ